jgi:hypothetical protein
VTSCTQQERESDRGRYGHIHARFEVAASQSYVSKISFGVLGETGRSRLKCVTSDVELPDSCTGIPKGYTQVSSNGGIYASFNRSPTLLLSFDSGTTVAGVRIACMF